MRNALHHPLHEWLLAVVFLSFWAKRERDGVLHLDLVFIFHDIITTSLINTIIISYTTHDDDTLQLDTYWQVWPIWERLQAINKEIFLQLQACLGILLIIQTWLSWADNYCTFSAHLVLLVLLQTQICWSGRVFKTVCFQRC